MLTDLSSLLATLIALSVATERLVSIIKNVVPYLSTRQATAHAERYRAAAVQLLAVAAGLATAYLAQRGQLLPAALPRWPLLGLLASGGSGFWTSILGYVTSVKDIRKSVAWDARVQAAANIRAIAHGAHSLAAPEVGGYQFRAAAVAAPLAGAGQAASGAASPAPRLSAEVARQADAKLESLLQAASAQL